MLIECRLAYFPAVLCPNWELQANPAIRADTANKAAAPHPTSVHLAVLSSEENVRLSILCLVARGKANVVC